MNLNYVGPSVLISPRGITFDNKKEDKYLYLFSAAELFDAIDHEYVGDEVYSYDAKMENRTGEALVTKLKRHYGEVEKVMHDAEARAETYIDNMVERIRLSTTLSEEEKVIYIENIRLMRSYMVQRYINKSVYYAVIQKLIERLRHNKLAYITATMNASCFHVLNTMQRCLRQQKSPVNSQVSFEEEGDALMVKLSIVN